MILILIVIVIVIVIVITVMNGGIFRLLLKCCNTFVAMVLSAILFINHPSPFSYNRSTDRAVCALTITLCVL